eukprot:gnl/TRDRNA2_/TRDRNA2_135025_c0_seq2.p1 gnl/TRDRNA2_/TRDRNA2_135025_c0~~gnl/TRDRNA2_/TRDRNA2_135025_c0_seq2.p1  ORF type:complete len:661 (-),score=163.64 gnl/TRDRNA2_/TRDRNA2_135025_c0_seq2:50-2032(-)
MVEAWPSLKEIKSLDSEDIVICARIARLSDAERNGTADKQVDKEADLKSAYSKMMQAFKDSEFEARLSSFVQTHKLAESTQASLKNLPQEAVEKIMTNTPSGAFSKDKDAVIMADVRKAEKEAQSKAQSPGDAEKDKLQLEADLRKFIDAHNVKAEVAKKLKSLNAATLRQVIDVRGSASLSLDKAKDVNAAILERIKKISEQFVTQFVKSAKSAVKTGYELDAEQLGADVHPQIKEKILERSHSLKFAQEIYTFVSEHRLPKRVEQALLMLPSSGVSAITKSKLKGTPEEKERMVLTGVKMQDSKVYGLYQKCCPGATDVMDKAEKKEKVDVKAKDRKTDTSKAKEPSPKRSRSRDRKRRSRDRRKTKSASRRRSRRSKSRSKSHRRRSRSKKRKKSRERSRGRKRQRKSGRSATSSSSSSSKKAVKKKSRSRSRSKRRDEKPAADKLPNPLAKTAEPVSSQVVVELPPLDKVELPPLNLSSNTSPEPKSSTEAAAGSEGAVGDQLRAGDNGVGGDNGELDAGTAPAAFPNDPRRDQPGVCDSTGAAAGGAGTEDGAVNTPAAESGSMDLVPISHRDPNEQQLWDWLTELDGGRGSLQRYFDVIRTEFDADFAQIGASRLAEPIGAGALGSIDPSFFEVVGVKSVGHRLLFAKGILGLK